MKNEQPTPIDDKQRPGKLRADHMLTIETRIAQQMYNGRSRSKNKEYITGFNRFGGLMSKLYLRASMEDPYFDYWLIEIEELIDNTLMALKAENKKLDELLHSHSKLQLSVPESVNPIKVRLGFRNPYGFRAAEVLMEFDELCKRLNAARHTARITTEQFHRIRQESSKLIRRLFEQPKKYPEKGMIISREEYRQKTRKALEAIKQFGELPDDVISGQRRASYAPIIKQSAYFGVKRGPKKGTVSLGNTNKKQ